MQRYTPILKLEIRHTYYENGLCKGLRAEPTAETQRRIRDHRLLLRYLSAGLEVYAPVMEDNSKAPPEDVLLIPLPAGLRLQWMLRPQSAEFFYFTELPPRPAKSIFRITNKGDAFQPAGFAAFGELAEGGSATPLSDSFGLLTQTHSLQFGLEQSPQDIALWPPAARTLDTDITLATVDPNSPFTIDLNEWAFADEKNLRYTGGPITGKVALKASYPVAVQTGGTALALLDLELPEAKKPSNPKIYTLQLRAQKVKWQYLIPAGSATAPALNHPSALKLIVDSASYAASISTLDKSNGPGTANAMAHLVWERMSPAFGPTTKMYYIGSDVPIPYQEKPLADIKIKDSAETTDIITGLRNPRSQDHGLLVAKGLDITNLLSFTP